MSWLRAASLVQGPGEERDVFDEEADESVLVQREWRNHMQRRVKVKLRGGGGRPLLYRVVRRGARRCEEAGTREERAEWSGPDPALPSLPPHYAVLPASC